MRNKKPLPLLENVLITDVAAEGKAIARVAEMVVFVPFVVPGDIVDLQIIKKKKTYAEARAARFAKYSENRCQPLCPHFGVCGGCKWQIFPYAEQLKYKQQQVIDNLTRIGKIDLPEPSNDELKGIMPIIGSAKTEYYRNKLEFTFSNKAWVADLHNPPDGGTVDALGFHATGSFSKVVNIEKCVLQNDISNKIRNEIRRYALEEGLRFFDIKNQEGFLRTMIVRNASEGELMLILVFYYDDKTLRNKLLTHIAEAFPQITSLLYIINSKANDSITDQKVNVFKGNDCIFEKMENLKFKIGAKTFFQTNTQQALELYRVVRKFAQLTGNELVYDLYTGTGTIANFIARYCGKVIGIESVPESIENAIVNSEINAITNAEFFVGDTKNILTPDFIRSHGSPEVIIVDPPRAGIHNDVIAAMLTACPQRIVYVSCNTATQGRDLNLLAEKYELQAIQPIDMFPHTHHIENVALLEQRVKNKTCPAKAGE
ncbi:MAG: 23S rRNA (uracil(1939)-C(5))-methyltransferase RlmD [Prevotellaceae bacterium]|jgi:23S rRNA (uracil1939-C5)-methyltransferase|nr:23S rRNA (uracil(1939)-C(5))-methyltransferase RlmD [Prevotellaceae bacterium]